jgi:dihydropyrimidinase
VTGQEPGPGNGFDLAINDALIVNAWGSTRGSIGVRGGTIAAIASEPLAATRLIDAAGRPVIPGVVDAHCHFRIVQGHGEDAIASSDDYVIGPRAAAFGGVTTFIDFAIQVRGRPAIEEARSRIGQASDGSVIDFSFHGALTDPRPESLDEIEPLMDMGIGSFKFFTAYAKWGFYVDLGFLADAMSRIHARGGTIAIHAENDEILEHWRALKSTDPSNMMNHSLSRPELAEEVAIRSVSALARETGALVYFVHVSTKRGMDAISDEKRTGARVLAETCPHYLAFSHDVYAKPEGRYFTMTPPLRAEGNRQALWDGVVDGAIDTVCSDHNSFTRAQKEAATGFLDVPPGVYGSETLLPYILSDGVNAGRIPLERAVEVLATNPARIFHLPAKGTIEVGKDADLVLLDLDETRLVTDSMLHDPGGYSLFAGREMRGWPIMTISRGEVIIENGECTATPGRGRFVPRIPQLQPG